MTARTAFIYALLDPVTRKPRYVGHSQDVERRVRYHWHDRMKETSSKGNPEFCAWLRALTSPPEYHIFESVPFCDRIKAERYYTDLLGQIPGISLLNINSGSTKPPELMAKVSASISAAKKGWNPSPETRTRMSAGQKARFTRTPQFNPSQDDPFVSLIAEKFGPDMVPSLRTLQRTLGIGQIRAQRLQARLKGATA